jgi:hypothetical protein
MIEIRRLRLMAAHSRVAHAASANVGSSNSPGQRRDLGADDVPEEYVEVTPFASWTHRRGLGQLPPSRPTFSAAIPNRLITRANRR